MSRPRNVFFTGYHRPFPALAAVLVAVAVALVIVETQSSAALRSSETARTGDHGLTLYSKAEQEQYINNQDDRTRGHGNNPFGNYRDTSPAQTKSPNGPFPGDEAVFTFNLYANSGLTKRVGTAIFTCEYNFDKNAFCDAAFQLKSRGTMLAEGSFSFDASRFSLAVTGGYEGYSGEKGMVLETPSAHHGQKLSFRFARSSTATAPDQNLGFHSVLTKTAFVNNADDRSRGQGHNPFGNPGSAITPPTNEKIFGPFAGDEGEFAFTLSTSASHESSPGSALFICQYNFDEGSFCYASFLLENGSLVGKGAYDFESERFTLGIVGGTAAYRNLTGTIQVSALGGATQPQPVARLVPMIQSQRLAITLKPTPVSRAARPRTIVRYSNVTHETFINNDDDEARGAVNNPFGTHQGKTPTAAASSDGPFPGDEALFGFGVFSSSNLKTGAGSGVYSCQYAFSKRAFCEASIQLDGGTLTADGELDFGARSWTMTVTGGTGKYSSLSGDVEATPSGKHAQRLTFHLD